MRKYCRKCGYEEFDNNNYYKFCPHCGDELVKDDGDEDYHVFISTKEEPVIGQFEFRCTEKEYLIVDSFVDKLRDILEENGFEFPNVFIQQM